MTKQQGTLKAFINHIICFRNALQKTRNLIMYKHMNLPVKDSIKMRVSELQLYYKKMEGEDEEKMVEKLWKEKEWHRLFRGRPSKKIIMMIKRPTMLRGKKMMRKTGIWGL